MNKPLLSFIHISDTHIYADPNATGEFVDFNSRLTVAQTISAINTLPMHVDFVLHTGDVMTDPDKDTDYEIAKDILKAIKYPVHYLVGNHDRSYGIQRYLVGREPDAITTQYDYELDINGVQMICLDTSSHQPHVHSGYLEEAQLRWLTKLINADDERPLVVALHHHVLPLGATWLDPIVLRNGEDLHKILLKAKDRLRGVFYGHIHENTVTVREGISYYSGLSTWFQTRTWYGQDAPANDPLLREPGFNVVTLTEKDTFVRRYRLPFKG